MRLWIGYSTDIYNTCFSQAAGVTYVFLFAERRKTKTFQLECRLHGGAIIMMKRFNKFHLRSRAIWNAYTTETLPAASTNTSTALCWARY